MTSSEDRGNRGLQQRAADTEEDPDYQEVDLNVGEYSASESEVSPTQSSSQLAPPPPASPAASPVSPPASPPKLPLAVTSNAASESAPLAAPSGPAAAPAPAPAISIAPVPLESVAEPVSVNAMEPQPRPALEPEPEVELVHPASTRRPPSPQPQPPPAAPDAGAGRGEPSDMEVVDLEEMRRETNRLKLELDLYKTLIQRFWSGSPEAEQQLCSMLGLPNRHYTHVIQELLSPAHADAEGVSLAAGLAAGQYRPFLRPQMSPAQANYLHNRREYLERKLAQHQDLLSNFYVGRPRSATRAAGARGGPFLGSSGQYSSRMQGIMDLFRQQQPSAPSIPSRSYAVDLHLGPYAAATAPASRAPSAASLRPTRSAFELDERQSTNSKTASELEGAASKASASKSSENAGPAPDGKPPRPKSSRGGLSTIDVNDMFDPYNDMAKRKESARAQLLTQTQARRPASAYTPSHRPQHAFHPPETPMSLSQAAAPALAPASTENAAPAPVNSTRSGSGTPRETAIVAVVSATALEPPERSPSKQSDSPRPPKRLGLRVPTLQPQNSLEAAGAEQQPPGPLGIGGVGLGASGGILRPKSGISRPAQQRRSLSVKFSDSVDVGAPNSYRRLRLAEVGDNVAGLDDGDTPNLHDVEAQFEQRAIDFLQKRLGLDNGGGQL